MDALETLIDRARLIQQLPAFEQRREIRKAARVPQRALAEFLKVSSASVCLYERGRTPKNPRVLRRYLEALRLMQGAGS
jgi:transcriptional regulator with XRE-family HTH domain